MRGLTRPVAVVVLTGVIAFGLFLASDSMAARKGCPLPDPGVFCPDVFDPVKCHGCLYGNACRAEAAGWNVAKECKPAKIK